MKLITKRVILVQALMLISVGLGWAADTPTDAVKTYAAKCASCHGKEGKGNPAMAKVFKVETDALDITSPLTQNKTDAELIKATTEGQGKMPAYKSKLSDKTIAELVSYIRSLAPKK